MSSLADFPGNCVTNTHILHDFAEIAYIVCTHAIPANTENVRDVNSPEKVLDRLRNAEKQFRQQSILVALDVEKLELYTFYRKVDVVKDQKTILAKFVPVCRLNACIIFAKSAARVLELLKPESSRIYRLFTSAVMSSIQVVSRNSEGVIPIGTRTYLVPVNESSNSHLGSVSASYPDWQLHRVNLQMTLTGQLILTVQNAKNSILTLMSDLERELDDFNPQPGSLLYLTPTGQIARYSGGLIGTKSELINASKAFPSGALSAQEARIALSQISTVSRWFKQRHLDTGSYIDDLARWIRIEIAVLEDSEELRNGSDKTLHWKTLIWPTKHTYIFKIVGDVTTSTKQNKQNATEFDPLRFTLDWYNSSAERSGQLARAQASKTLHDDGEDDHLFTDDVHFEDHYHPQTFGPPAFPASQMVYPTPPEAMITHQTPGMSSVDGMAPTPAPIVGVNHAESENFLDQEMSDIRDSQPPRVGTGFYDEDLFEEMPDDKFESNADGEEPNWDFFDPPGFEPTQASSDKAVQSQDSPKDQETSTDIATNALTVKDDEFPTLESLKPDKEGNETNTDISPTRLSPDRMESVYANDLSFSPTDIHQQHEYISSILTEPIDTIAVSSADYRHDLTDSAPHVEPFRRRSSVYEGVFANIESKGHDSRYGKHGKYWFNNEPTRELKRVPQPISSLQNRPSSSGSDASMTSRTSGSDVSSPVNGALPLSNKRTWTEYHPESPVEEMNFTDDTDYHQVEAQIQSLLTVVNNATGEDPFLIQMEPLVDFRKRSTYSTQKTMMIAQVLYDQISQATLLRNEYGIEMHRRGGCAQVDILMDHSGNRASITHATLADLASLPPRNGAKIATLTSRLVCINRAEVEILARQTILPFWDILGLQPYSEPKNITTFCVFQKSSNVADGCSAFLNRLADTYSSCNLGNHNIGQLPGLTNNGLLCWTPQSASEPNLKQLCQRLGYAIGGAVSILDNTVVVYMVSPNNDPSSYYEQCSAFTFLYDAFVEKSEGLKKDMELVVQIIPIDFIAAPTTLVVPSQPSYIELALEVYNRIPVGRFTDVVASCGSAVILENYQLRDPSFELTNAIVSPFSKEGICLHLAYAYSLDNRWLTAAWSDERGLIAFTMVYCLTVGNGSKAHPKSDVLRNLWDISHDIMSRSREKWRLIVAHTGPYEVEDASQWQLLATQASEERKSMSRLVLISVDLNPDIFVTTPSPAIKLAHQPAIAQVTNVSNTPATTPQGNMTSPDHIIAATPTSGSLPPVNAATPPDHNFESGQDIETTLVNPAEQSWAVSLAFGLNQSSNILEIRPAAASGLLVKRIGTKEENKTLRLLGVNLIAAPRLPPTTLTGSEKEAILHEIMEQYRGLVTLAASRGCIDKNLDCIPWHIATVLKGSRVLGQTM